MIEYGAKGCTCWPNEDRYGNDYADWLPNAQCRHHGILADVRPPRTDTGVYRVVPAQEILTPEEADEPDSLLHFRRPMTAEEAERINAAIRDGRVTPPPPPTRPRGGTLPPYTPREGDTPALLSPGGPRWSRWGEYEEPVDSRPTTEEEHGVFAAVRRWIRWLSGGFWS